jgi:DNA-binding CsgD family transcriptional regulator
MTRISKISGNLLKKYKMQSKLAVSPKPSKELSKLMTFLFDGDNKDFSGEVSQHALPYFKMIKADLHNAKFKTTFYNTLLQINARRNNLNFDDVQLTDRESEVLEMLLQGYKYRQMCSKFNVSLDTIFTHVRNLYKKLQVGSRHEMASKILYCGASIFILIFSIL